MATLTDRLAAAVKSAREITDKAKEQGRNLTDWERTEVEGYLATAKSIKAQIQENQATNGLGGAGSMAAEFVGTKSRFQTPVSALWPGKTATFDGTYADLAPSRVPGTELGFDRRYVRPALPSTGLGSNVTQVQFTQQESRDVVVGSGDHPIVRSLTATTPKFEVGTVRTLETADVKTLAAIESNLPNYLMAPPDFAANVEQDILIALREAEDDYIVQQITAGAGSTDLGADLYETSINAQADFAAAGLNANLAIVSPGDFKDFALLQSAGSEKLYYQAFAQRELNLGLRVVVSKNVSDGSPIFVDTSVACRIAESPISVSRFEENAGASNSQLVRAEFNACVIVPRPGAVMVAS